MKAALASIIACCAVACSAFGQWSASVWPSYAYPRESKAQFSEVYSAAVERCHAAGLAIDGPKWHKYGYQNMTNVKARIGAAIPYYIVTNNQGGDISGLIVSNSVRYYTATGLLASVRMPTNYLDYTPWSNLSGCGPFTNEGMAWGNGWTNAQTAAGGTNFPTGRTNWYTSDYGLMHITNLFSPLVWVKPDLKWDTTRRYGASINSDVDLAKSAAATNFHDPNSVVVVSGDFPGAPFGIGRLATIDQLSPPNNYAVIQSYHARFYLRESTTVTNKCNADYYAKADAPAAWATFDNFGESVQTNWTRVAQDTGVFLDQIDYEMGTTNIPPSWPANPPDSSITEIGWFLTDNFLIVLKLDGADGFRYR